MNEVIGTHSHDGNLVHDRLSIPRQKIEKQTPTDRVNNFDETYMSMTMDAAIVEAARCIDCPSAPCMDACPVHNDIPSALKMLENDDVLGAASKFRETSTLPEMCGRLCPQEILCEGACVVGFALRTDGSKHPPVAIGRLEAFITDEERKITNKFPVRFVGPTTNRRVAIIGSGPAGLTVAEELQVRGHMCTIFDRWPEAGGVLRYGIPNFKMNKEILEEKLTSLREIGVEFKNSVEIGTDVTLGALRNQHGFDSIFLGNGAGIGNLLKTEGEDLTHVYQATDFLVRGNLDDFELPEDQRGLPFVGDDVVVVGGGDTSMDCVRTAVRLGAKNVTCVYRRTENEMLGRTEERVHAREEGVIFSYLTTPTRFISDEEGKVVSVELVQMKLSEPDDSGRRRPVQIEDSEYTISASAVVIAIGYNADSDLGESSEVETDNWGLIQVDSRTGQTNIPYIFAGGDVVNGADLVVTAIADGKRAATWVHQYLLSLGVKDSVD
jgi:glutamate synthase (NADPH/NADH) small chain